jgi:hypothetical protein
MIDVTGQPTGAMRRLRRQLANVKRVLAAGGA